MKYNSTTQRKSFDPLTTSISAVKARARDAAREHAIHRESMRCIASVYHAYALGAAPLTPTECPSRSKPSDQNWRRLPLLVPLSWWTRASVVDNHKIQDVKNDFQRLDVFWFTAYEFDQCLRYAKIAYIISLFASTVPLRTIFCDSFIPLPNFWKSYQFWSSKDDRPRSAVPRGEPAVPLHRAQQQKGRKICIILKNTVERASAAVQLRMSLETIRLHDVQ